MNSVSHFFPMQNYCAMSLSPVLVLLFLLHFKFGVIEAQNQGTRFHVQRPCSEDTDCDSKATGLLCLPAEGEPGLTKTCTCPNSNLTTFDEYQRKCVGRIGHPCHQQSCPVNAQCGNQDPVNPSSYFYEPRCFCDLHYYGSERRRRCLPSAKYGDPCPSVKDRKCDDFAGLSCVDGKCSCSLGRDAQYYDAKRGRCVSFIGKQCSGFNSCPQNARCEEGPVVDLRRKKRQSLTNDTTAPTYIPAPPPLRFYIWTPNASPPPRSVGIGTSNTNKRAVEGKCVCEYGFSPTSAGKCFAAYRQSCSRTQLCNEEDHLACIDGSCKCKSPLSQMYDTSGKRCVNLVGAKCDSTTARGYFSCVPNSQCVNGVCACKEGYTEVPSRTQCLLAYEQSCEGGGQCNNFNALACREHHISTNNVTKAGGKTRCLCMDDSLTYDDQLEACVSGVGSPCGKVRPGIDYNSKEEFYIACEPRVSECMPDRRGEEGRSYCQLKSRPDQSF